MDLDETMTTSTNSTPSAPPDAFDDDNLFPDTQSNHQALTPSNDHLNAAAPGELSPPRSHSNSEEVVPLAVANGTSQQANMSATRSAAKGPAADTAFSSELQGEDATTVPGANAAGERDDRPGHGWRNKKAQEEMQRAWDHVTDRDFSLKEYGDVVLRGKEVLGQN